MSIKELFKSIYTRLKLANIEQAHLEASWIIESFANISELDRIKNPEQSVDIKAQKKIELAAEERTLGRPLAYILGEKEFYGFKFKVTNEVLIPRPETEEIIEWAIGWVQKTNKRSEKIEILDLGTGSGCIGLTLLKMLPNAYLTALDISKPALKVAQENATYHKINERCQFVNLDAGLANNLLNKFDLIVANPPYIDFSDKKIELNVKNYEPHSALFAEDDGFAAVQKWSRAAITKLKPISAMCFEIGHNHGAKADRIFRELNIFTQQYILKDLNGLDRFVCGEINS